MKQSLKGTWSTDSLLVTELSFIVQDVIQLKQVVKAGSWVTFTLGSVFDNSSPGLDVAAGLGQAVSQNLHSCIHSVSNVRMARM